MTNGILVFEGMTVGIVPGDLTVGLDKSGSVNSKAILSTAYNVLPLWLRIANDQVRISHRWFFRRSLATVG